MAEGLGPAEAESREFAVIREHYSLLVKTISSNITYFAVKFYEKKFISYSSKRDITSILGVGEEVIADKLLEKALNNLSIARSKEKWFHVFTAIFRAECAYQDLADTMEEFYADSCQSVVVSIRAEVAEFDERFRFVVYNTRCHLYRREKEQDDFLTQFKMMLKDLSLAKKHSSNAFLKEREEIESATSSDEIIDIIDPYWSFSNCGFLRCIIRIFGTRELKQEMKTYVTDIEDFQKKTKVKDWYMATMGEAKTAEHYERLCITVNEDWEERTLYDAYQFKKDLDIKAAITNEAASPVIDFDIGSLKIVMAFAPVVVPEVKVVIEDPQFRLSHNIVEAVWLPSSTSSLPQPSSQPSFDQRARAITGVVIASIVGVGRKLFKKITNMGRQRTEAPELSQRDQLNDDPRVKEQSQMEDDTKRTLVLNLWPDGDELEELLYDGNPGTIPESAKKDAHQLTALITKDNCQFFYLIRRVSREELRTTNETAWELLRDFNTQSFPSKVLHKFIDVWVFDENKVIGGILELVPGPILTVNVSLNKWRGNMKGCAQLVRSKARTNIDSPDGRFSPSHTLSATESPPRVSSVLTNSDQNHTPGLVPEAAEVQTAAAPELRQSPGPHPPLYQQPRNQDSSQTPHQQSPPKQLPPPYNNGTHPETDTGGFLKEILYVLKDIRTSGGRTATAAEQSAQNTSLMRERQGETLALTEEIHDTVTAPSEDTHEAT